MEGRAGRGVREVFIERKQRNEQEGQLEYRKGKRGKTLKQQEKVNFWTRKMNWKLKIRLVRECMKSCNVSRLEDLRFQLSISDCSGCKSQSRIDLCKPSPLVSTTKTGTGARLTKA